MGLPKVTKLQGTSWTENQDFCFLIQCSVAPSLSYFLSTQKCFLFHPGVPRAERLRDQYPERRCSLPPVLKRTEPSKLYFCLLSPFAALVVCQLPFLPLGLFGCCPGFSFSLNIWVSDRFLYFPDVLVYIFPIHIPYVL